jgi:5S rRNA maturation endonuclease (ribonuclease M5)
LDTLNVVDIRSKVPFDPESFEKLEPLNSEALAYLNKRFPGVSQSQLDVFSLRYSARHHAIAIPTSSIDHRLQGIKFRFIAPVGDLRYIAEEGSQFGGYWIDGKTDKLLITEGEFDAITARVLGFEGTILALQTNKLSQESVQRVMSFKHVFLALDNDKAGQEGTQLIQQIMLGRTPEKVSFEDCKDLNELLQKEGIHEGSRLLRSKTKTELERSTVELSQSISEMLEFLQDKRNTRGTSTGYGSLDSLLGGGLRPGEVTVINAFAKTGKTSFVNNLAHNLAAAGKKIAIASFEMDPARTLYPSLLSIAGQTNVRTLPSDVLAESVQLIQDECSYLSNIITLKRFGYTSWNEVEEWAHLMIDQHKIDFLFLDHAGFMAEKMTDAEENQILAKNISKLSKSTGLHIPVVVQAPKTKDGLSIQTAYGGLAWAMNADNFIILERSKDNDMELKVRLEAARYPGANPSNTPALLFYDRETCTLTE